MDELKNFIKANPKRQALISEIQLINLDRQIKSLKSLNTAGAQLLERYQPSTQTIK